VTQVTSHPFDAYDDTALLLHSAVAGDAEAIAGRFADVSGCDAVTHAYQVAVCLVATMIGDELPGGGAALEFPDIDEATYDARWVARFVSAYANADGPTGEALFGAAVADGQLPVCMMTLTGSTLATLRHRTSG
jgi:hypothetical protein